MPDLAVASLDDGTITVLLNGEVTLGSTSAGPSSVTYATGSNSQPSGTAIADLNGDGKPDLAVALSVAHAAGVFLETCETSSDAGTAFTSGITNVTVSPSSTCLPPSGGSVAFTAGDQAGPVGTNLTINLTSSVDWTSSDQGSVITFSSSSPGVATTVSGASGPTTVMALLNGAFGTATLNIGCAGSGVCCSTSAGNVCSTSCPSGSAICSVNADCPSGATCAGGFCSAPSCSAPTAGSVGCADEGACSSGWLCCAALRSDGSIEQSSCVAPPTNANGSQGTATCPSGTTQVAGTGLAACNPAGSPQVLASGQAGPAGITTDYGNNLYWVDTQSGLVWMLPIGGGQATSIASGQNRPVSIASDGSKVYWTNQGDGTVMYLPIPPNGAMPSSVASNPGGGSQNGVPVGIAADGEFVAWTNQTDGSVMAISVSNLGATATMIQPSSTTSGPWGITDDGTNVYWTNKAAGSVVYVPESTISGGGTVTPIIAAIGLNAPMGIASSAYSSNLYWVDNGDGTVWSLPVSSLPAAGQPAATPVALASGQGGPVAIAMDPSSNVYWTNQTAGTVVGIAQRDNTYTPSGAIGNATTEFATCLQSPQGITWTTQGPYWTDADGAVYFGCGM
jgi:hypothetical protein